MHVLSRNRMISFVQNGLISMHSSGLYFIGLQAAGPQMYILIQIRFRTQTTHTDTTGKSFPLKRQHENGFKWRVLKAPCLWQSGRMQTHRRQV